MGAASGPIRARENGRPIRWRMTQGAARQAIALSVETSNSMKGARIAAVLKGSGLVRWTTAAWRRPRRVLVLGAGEPRRRLPREPSHHNGDAKQLGPAGPDATALYASIVQASSGLSQVDARQRALIVVTDGQSLRDHKTSLRGTCTGERSAASSYVRPIRSPNPRSLGHQTVMRLGWGYSR
jgi:hypothetical protein